MDVQISCDRTAECPGCLAQSRSHLLWSQLITLCDVVPFFRRFDVIDAEMCEIAADLM